MSNWTLIQMAFNLFTLGAFLVLWLKSRRPPQDDPRLSRGLQLLQTKITVLEDLSDRTDSQVKQLTSLLDQKTRMLQNKVIEAEQQVLKIDHSMNRSMEVAEIFQDKIPHQEILERQRTVEYVKAARLAHSGMSVEDIAERVALPFEQIELIAKFNREQLMFDETQLPEWVNKPSTTEPPNFALNNIDFIGNLEKPEVDFGQINKIETDFKQAVKDIAAQQAQSQQPIIQMPESMAPAVMSFKATAQTLKDKIVATAEDMLRQQDVNLSNSSGNNFSKAQATSSLSAKATAAYGASQTKAVDESVTASNSARRGFSSQSAIVSDKEIQVKKVIFPRIEK